MTNKEYCDKVWNETMSRMGCGVPMISVFIVGMLLLLSSCATKREIQYVDRDVVMYKTKIQHDTITNNIHDSIFHNIYTKGDTVYDTKYVEKTRFRDRIVVRIDTCYKDSIQTITKESVKERKIIPSWCYCSLVVSILFVIFAIYKIINR